MQDRGALPVLLFQTLHRASLFAIFVLLHLCIHGISLLLHIMILLLALYCIVVHCIYGFLKRLSQYNLIRGAPSAKSPASKEKTEYNDKSITLLFTFFCL